MIEPNNFLGLSFIALMLYISGYLAARGIIQHPNPTMAKSQKIIFPPTWLNYLCGARGSIKFPMGATTIAAIRAQVAGIVFGIFAFVVGTQRLGRDEFLIGIALCVFVPFILPLLITKNRRINYLE